MTGPAVADGPVLRRRRLAAGVPGDGADDAVDMLEDTLHAPEASAGDDGDLGRRRRSHGLVDRWRWNLARLFGGRPARNKACGHRDKQNAQT